MLFTCSDTRKTMIYVLQNVNNIYYKYKMKIKYYITNFNINDVRMQKRKQNIRW